jgi:hypothetical protein
MSHFKEGITFMQYKNLAVSVAMHVMNLMCEVAENFIEENRVTNPNINLIDNSLIELSGIFDFGLDAHLTIANLYDFQKELIVTYKAVEVVKRVQRISELFMEDPFVFNKIKNLGDVLQKAKKERDRFEHLALFMNSSLLNMTVLNDERQDSYLGHAFQNFDPFGFLYDRPDNSTLNDNYTDDAFLSDEQMIYDYY